jgi:hypothetical protein
MTLFEVLTLRSQWESIVTDYKLNSYDGTIDNLEYFIENGIKGNRFRTNFELALNLAETIVNYYGSMEFLDKKLER